MPDPKAPLTDTEKAALDVVRTWASVAGSPIRAADVKHTLWVSRRVHYSSVSRDLSSLVAKGLLTRPDRGMYQPNDKET